MSGGGEEDDDKQFDPTPKKLEDARKKGEIAKSNDLTTAASYGGFLLAAVAFGTGSLLSFGTVLSALLDRADSFAEVAFSGSATPLMGGAIWESGMAVLPWLAIPGIVALLAVIAQQAVVFAPSKLAPKVSRISPISGVKNKFGRQGLFEFAKSASKLVIYGVITGAFLTAQIDRILASMALSPAVITAEMGRMVVELLFLVLCVALVLGGIDYMWQSAEHIRKNRMSRKEIMDEMKQSEGDPMMKQQRRQRGMMLAANKMLGDVPKADVVIVNPTHYAVALKWDRSAAGAPVCIAKGVDEIAARIREIAIENAIPIHSDPPTARALHASVELEQEILPEHYAAVAAAIRFAESIRRKAGAR